MSVPARRAALAVAVAVVVAVPPPAQAGTASTSMQLTAQVGHGLPVPRSYTRVDAAGRLSLWLQDGEDRQPVAAAVPAGSGYRGPAASWQSADGRLRVLALTRRGSVVQLTKAGAYAALPGPGDWTVAELSGDFAAPPAVAATMDDQVAAVGLDRSGRLWVAATPVTGPYREPSAELAPWRELPTPDGVRLDGRLAAVALMDRSVGLLAVDTGGTAWVARYRFGTPDGELTGWRRVGGGPISGTPTLGSLPNAKLGVLAHSAAGSLVFQEEPFDGTGGFDGPWLPVPGAPHDAVGRPSLLFDQGEAELVIATRTRSGRIAVGREQSPFSFEFGWTTLPQPAGSDPVVTQTLRDDELHVTVATLTPTGNLHLTPDDDLNPSHT